MRRALLLSAACVLAACGSDADRFQIALSLDTAGCGGACVNLPMSCDAEMMVRVMPVGDQLAQPYVVVCDRITGGGDLCDIASLDLSGVPEIPNEMVEIQVGVWRYDEDDPDDEDPDDDSIDCGPLAFDLSGGIQRIAPEPAIAGRAFFEVGSDEVAHVTLECLNAPELDDQSCRLPDTVHVTASVRDFKLALPVGTNVAEQLEVRVGEPELLPFGWRLFDADTTQLIDMTGTPPHTWTEPIGSAIAFTDVGCVQVEKVDEVQSATTVSCVEASPTTEELEITGWYVDTETLSRVRDALGLSSLPAEGIVIGLVLDASGAQPQAGAVITSDPATTEVLYVTDDFEIGGTTTSSRGMFLTVETGFLKSWTGRVGMLQDTLEPGFGGPVGGKVTVVVLQMEPPPT